MLETAISLMQSGVSPSVSDVAEGCGHIVCHCLSLLPEPGGDGSGRG